MSEKPKALVEAVQKLERAALMFQEQYRHSYLMVRHKATNDLIDAALEFAAVFESAAVSLGRKGGEKGGRARAEALSPERRSEIASIAAAKRWGAK